MTRFRSLRCLALCVLTAGIRALASPVCAQSATPDSARAHLDTAAILASARPDIGAANAAWLPGLRTRNAALIAAAYADSGLFIAADGAVTRGRAAVAERRGVPHGLESRSRWALANHPEFDILVECVRVFDRSDCHT